MHWLSLNICKSKAERGSYFPCGNSWDVWALVESLVLGAFRLNNRETCMLCGVVSGHHLPSVVITEKRIVVRPQSHRNIGVSFVLWACIDYNSTLKAKWVAHGILQSALTLVWSLPEASSVPSIGIQGWRICGLFPWGTLFFQHFLNTYNVPKYCAMTVVSQC